MFVNDMYERYQKISKGFVAAKILDARFKNEITGFRSQIKQKFL